MQAFLGVYELLLEVFNHADSRTNAVAARSSKLLSEPALDVLWRVVPRASYLFSVLGTLDGVASYDGHSTRRFDYERDIHPQDWERFLPYSRRVEEISCLDDVVSDRWNEPSHKALAKVSASRPPHLTQCDIFPRLRHLTWSVYSHKVLRNIAIFLVPTLTFLEIKIDNTVETRPMVAFLKQLQSRCASNLREFRLNTDFSATSVEEDVLELIKSMTRLERLTLPRFWITERVFSAMSQLPSLQYVGQRKAYWWGNAEDTENGLLLAIESLESGAFPALKDITYDTNSLYESKRFLSSPNTPKLLTSLCVTSSKLEAPHQLQDFLTCLSSSSPQLEELDIGLTFAITDAPGHSTDITVTTLRPLHLLLNLNHFGLATHFPLKMTDDDLETFTSGWTQLKVLWLNETPAHAVQRDVKSELSLTALRILAKNCPNLEELSIFLDASAIPEETPSTAAAGSSKVPSGDFTTLQALALGLNAGGGSLGALSTFKKLRYLNLGVSHVASTTSVANYLTDCISIGDPSSPEDSSPKLLPTFTSSNITPKPPPFFFDCSPRFWPAPIPASELDGVLTRRRENWEDVGKMIPALMEQKVRMEVMRKEMMGLINGLVALKVEGKVVV